MIESLIAVEDARQGVLALARVDGRQWRQFAVRLARLAAIGERHRLAGHGRGTGRREWAIVVAALGRPGRDVGAGVLLPQDGIQHQLMAVEAVGAVELVLLLVVLLLLVLLLLLVARVMESGAEWLLEMVLGAGTVELLLADGGLVVGHEVLLVEGGHGGGLLGRHRVLADAAHRLAQQIGRIEYCVAAFEVAVVVVVVTVSGSILIVH